MDEYDVMGNYTGYDMGYEQPVQPVMPDQYQAPPSYDDFGNPVYNMDEEERRRKEIERQIEEYRRSQEELASQVVHKQEIITNADGTQTVKTTQTKPAQPLMPQEYSSAGRRPSYDQYLDHTYRGPTPQPRTLTPEELDRIRSGATIKDYDHTYRGPMPPAAPVQPVVPVDEMTPAQREQLIRRDYIRPDTERMMPGGPGRVMTPEQIEQLRRSPVPGSNARAAVDQSVYTAQMESGGRPDIGYHAPGKSTAYGTYGLTAPAYQDVQRADPYFANKPITELTPEDQTRAYQVYTGLNAQSLQRQGVEPTEANQRLAHFLGAKGAADYLKTGYISPQAARANGGEANVRRIANARLAGQVSPASGAVTRGMEAGAGRGTFGMPFAQPEEGVAVATGQGVQGTTEMRPAPTQPIEPVELGTQAPIPEVKVETPEGATAAMPATEAPRMAPNSYDEFGTPVYSENQATLDKHLKDFENIQNDPKALMNFESPYDWMNQNAKNRAADLLSNQRDTEKATDMLKTATETDLAKYLRAKDDDKMKIRLKGMLFAMAGNKEMAQRYLDKLDDIGTDKYVQGPDGKPYLLKVRANGEVIKGYNAETGKEIGADEIAKVGAVNIVTHGKDIYIGEKGGAGSALAKGIQTHTGKMQDITTGAVYYERTSPAGIELIDNQGKKYEGPSSNLRPFGIGSDIATQNILQQQKLKNQLLYEPAIAAATKGASYLAEFNAKHGTNFAIAGRDALGMPLIVDQSTGQVATSPAGTPAAAPAAAPAPAAAGGRVEAVPPTPLTAPAAAPAAAPGKVAAAVSPADIESQRKAAEEQRKKVLEVTANREKKFDDVTVPEIGQSSNDGQVVANARRQQLDIIKRNPSIINIMNGQGTQYDNARAIMIKAVSGAYGNEEKEQLNKDLSAVMNKLTEGERGALQEFVNLNTTVNAKTLRANAGPGAVSNAEQTANKEANVGNVDRIPAYAALAGLHRSQFTGDLAASKQAFLERNPQLVTVRDFNNAWQKEEAVRLKEYQAIAKARFDVMGKPPAADASPEAIKAYRDRVFRAFEAYPAPQFDPSTGKWNYQTANARRAAMAAILGQ